MDSEELLLRRWRNISEEIVLEHVLTSYGANHPWLGQLEHEETLRDRVNERNFVRAVIPDMRMLLKIHRDRNAASWNDVLMALKLTPGVTEDQLVELATKHFLRVALKPPSWKFRSKCKRCGVMPAPEVRSNCHWCNTLRPVHALGLTEAKKEDRRNPGAAKL